MSYTGIQGVTGIQGATGAGKTFSYHYYIPEEDMDKVLSAKLKDLPLLFNDYAESKGIMRILKFRLEKMV